MVFRRSSILSDGLAHDATRFRGSSFWTIFGTFFIGRCPVGWCVHGKSGGPPKRVIFLSQLRRLRTGGELDDFSVTRSVFFTTVFSCRWMSGGARADGAEDTFSGAARMRLVANPKRVFWPCVDERWSPPERRHWSGVRPTCGGRTTTVDASCRTDGRSGGCFVESPLPPNVYGWFVLAHLVPFTLTRRRLRRAGRARRGSGWVSHLLHPSDGICGCISVVTTGMELGGPTKLCHRLTSAVRYGGRRTHRTLC